MVLEKHQDGQLWLRAVDMQAILVLLLLAPLLPFALFLLHSACSGRVKDRIFPLHIQLTLAGDTDPDLDPQASFPFPPRVSVLAGGGCDRSRTVITSGTQTLQGKKKKRASQHLTRPRRMTVAGNVEFVPGLGNTPRAQPPSLERSLSDSRFRIDNQIPALPKQMTVVGPSEEDKVDSEGLSESSTRGRDPDEPPYLQGLMRDTAFCKLSHETLSTCATLTQLEAKMSAVSPQVTDMLARDSSAVMQSSNSVPVSQSEAVPRPRLVIVSQVPNIPLGMLQEQGESMPVLPGVQGADEIHFNTEKDLVVDSQQSSKRSSSIGLVPGPPVEMLSEGLVPSNDLPKRNTEVCEPLLRTDDPPPLSPRSSTVVRGVPNKQPETRETVEGPSLDPQSFNEGSEMQQKVVQLLTRMSCLGLENPSEIENPDFQVSQLLSRMSQLGIQEAESQDSSLPSRERLKRISQLVLQNPPEEVQDVCSEAQDLSEGVHNPAEETRKLPEVAENDTKGFLIQEKISDEEVVDSIEKQTFVDSVKKQISQVHSEPPEELQVSSEEVPSSPKAHPVTYCEKRLLNSSKCQDKPLSSCPLPQRESERPSLLPLDKSSYYDDLSMETSSQEVCFTSSDMQDCGAWVFDSCGQEGLAEMLEVDEHSFPFSAAHDDDDDNDIVEFNCILPKNTGKKTGCEVLKQEEAEELSATKRQSAEVFQELLQMRQKHLVAHRLSGLLSDQSSSSRHSSCETLGSNSDLTETGKKEKCGPQKTEGQSTDNN